MRHQYLLGSVVAVLFAAGSAVADDKTKTNQGNRNSVQSVINQLDKNNDGALSRDELPADMRSEFADLDKNNDGKLSGNELRSHVEQLRQHIVPVEVISIWTIEAMNPVTLAELQEAYDSLRQLDSDHNGKISADEVKAGRENAVSHRIDSIFKRCDANKDGKLQKDECPQFMSQCFDRFDSDKDGALTKDELRNGIMKEINTTSAHAGTSNGSGK